MSTYIVGEYAVDGVEYVLAGNNIVITGSPSLPIINSTATSNINIVAGLGMSVSQNNNTITITNAGMLGIQAGNNIVITGNISNPTISANIPNSSINLNAGSGISITGSNSNPTISNTGILNLTAGNGISITGNKANSTILNTGVLGLTAGNNIIISGNVFNPTISANIPNNSINLNAGSGISITGSNSNPTISNTGVLALSAGSGITLSGNNSNITISSSGANLSPNLNTPALNSMEPTNQNVSGYAIYNQTYLVLYGVMSAPITPPWVCNTRFIKFDYYIPITRTLTCSSALPAPPTEIFTFQCATSLSGHPVNDPANVSITLSANVTTNGETSNFILSGSSVFDISSILSEGTQFFLWINTQNDLTGFSDYLNYVPNNINTTNWCVATPIIN